MLIYGRDPGKAPAGWEWRWRGAAFEDVGRLLTVWSAYAQAGKARLPGAAAEQGARLRQTVSLPPRRLVIGTLKQFSVVFVNKVSLFSTRGMKMRFGGLQRAVSFGHFICLGAPAEVGGRYLLCPKPC